MPVQKYKMELWIQSPLCVYMSQHLTNRNQPSEGTALNLKLDESTETPTSYVTLVRKSKYPVPRGHIVVVFYIRASYRLPSISFYDNRASHSQDTIGPWKFKVKGIPVSAASSWLISLVVYNRASYRLPSLLFYDNWASHSWNTIGPWKFKVKGQGQRSRSKVP